MNRVLRRGVAIGLLAVLVAGVWWGIVAPVLAYQTSLEQQYTAAMQQLARQRAAITHGAVLQQQLTRVRAAESSDPRLLAVGSISEVAALLQQRAQQIVLQSGGQIRSIQVLPAVDDAGLQRVAVRMDLTMPEDFLPDMLTRIEATPSPMMTVSSIDLQGTNQTSVADAAGRTRRLLTVRTEISTYMTPRPR